MHVGRVGTRRVPSKGARRSLWTLCALAPDPFPPRLPAVAFPLPGVSAPPMPLNRAAPAIPAPLGPVPSPIPEASAASVENPGGRLKFMLLSALSNPSGWPRFLLFSSRIACFLLSSLTIFAFSSGSGRGHGTTPLTCCFCAPWYKRAQETPAGRA